MRAHAVVAHLLDSVVGPGRISEASVHLPARSRKWVAAFTGVEPGKQIWKTTGLTDRSAALALARQWEAEARRQRRALGLGRKTASLRVRRRQGSDSDQPSTVFRPLSQNEIATLLHMSERAVRNVEQRALAKLRNHPLVRELWAEYTGETLECRWLPPRPICDTAEDSKFTAAEKAALFELADDAEERCVLKKLFRMISVPSS